MIASASPKPLSPTKLTASAEPDLSLSIGDSRCSLWWGDTPDIGGHRVGCIGQLEVPEGAPGSPLLDVALEALRAHHCTIAVGPMDGNTWRNYRLVTSSDGSPPFPFEPSNPVSLQADFDQSGFRQIAEFTSSSLPIVRRDLGGVGGRIAARGITVREIDLDDFAGELRRLYRLCLSAFAANFLYTPISETEFVNMYLAAKEIADPRFVLLAEDADGDPAGFVFTYPHIAAPTSLIVKTLAVHPKKHHLGLGSFLVSEVQTKSLCAGYRTAVHALQHRNNSSLKITARHGARIIREYTLYAKEIA